MAEENEREAAQREADDIDPEAPQVEIAKRALAMKQARPAEPHPETTPADRGQEPTGDQVENANQRKSNLQDAHTESLGRSGGARQSDQG